VHGTPYKGFWYDIGLFWMSFDNRTETQNIGNTDFIILNTGSSRHRGLEGKLYYDFLAPFQHPPLPQLQPEPGKAVVDKDKVTLVPGVLPSDYRPFQFLDAELTESALLQPGTDHTIVGNTPAFAPDIVLKAEFLFKENTVST
jgi:hypothetical protein